MINALQTLGPENPRPRKPRPRKPRPRKSQPQQTCRNQTGPAPTSTRAIRQNLIAFCCLTVHWTIRRSRPSLGPLTRPLPGPLIGPSTGSQLRLLSRYIVCDHLPKFNHWALGSLRVKPSQNPAATAITPLFRPMDRSDFPVFHSAGVCFFTYPQFQQGGFLRMARLGKSQNYLGKTWGYSWG
jgi:hypothetical protein